MTFYGRIRNRIWNSGYWYSEQCFIHKKCFKLYRKASQIVQQNEGMMKGEADMARCLLCPTRLGLRLQENIATGGGGERGERREGREERGERGERREGRKRVGVGYNQANRSTGKIGIFHPTACVHCEQ